MASKVYFTDLETYDKVSLLTKMEKLVKAAGLLDIDMEKKFVAIKIHFGEYGNLTYPKPQYVKVLADIIKAEGGIPFMVDCNTLYVGMRKNAVEHLQCAEMNGFNSVTTGCQTIIGDGLKGSDDVEIPIKDSVYCETAKIGRAVADADVIITLNHFKCHEITGFGGALKNLGMGCASRRGKMELHNSGKPFIKTENCVGCGKCLTECAHDALKLKGIKMTIDHGVCVGCGLCFNDTATTEIYTKYFPNGAGSIFTFEIRGDGAAARKFTESLKLFSLLANVADVKSLVIHPASTTHSQLSEEELLDQGIRPNTIRLSIGTEHTDDIIEDLENGFAAV